MINSNIFYPSTHSLGPSPQADNQKGFFVAWYILISSIFRDFKTLTLSLSHVCPFLLWTAAQPNTCLLASWRHLHCPHWSFAASAPIHELLCKLSSHHSSRDFFFPQEIKICSKWKLSSVEQNRKEKKKKKKKQHCKSINQPNKKQQQ